MTRKRRSLGRTNDHTRDPEVLDAIGGRKELELDPLLDPWERQPKETARNYGLFTLYRDHGRLRSMAQAAAPTDLTYASVARVGRYNKWVQRAAAWDAEQDRITSIRLLDAREEMARVHQKAARQLLDKALERLATLDANTISPHALILMMDTAARIERAALGLETMKGAQAAATQVTVAASAKTDDAGKPEVRVEVGVQHDRIMAQLDAMVERMSPEQLAAGYQELSASAEEATRELDAALPAPPPQ